MNAVAIDGPAGRDTSGRSLPYLATFALATGVAAVVLALAVSHGAALLSKAPASGLGRDVVVVQGAAPSLSGIGTADTSSSLTTGDVAALGNAGYVPAGAAVAPTTGVREEVSAFSRFTATDVIGSTDALAGVLGYALAQGRFITAADVSAGAPVVVLGQSVVSSLFAGGDPVGQYVVIDGKSFLVVGTLQARGFSGTYDQDNVVILPITTAWQTLPAFHSASINQVLIRADSPQAATSVVRQATNTLLQRHGIVDPALADFTVVAQTQQVAQDIGTGLALRRVLEWAGVALLIAGTLHLASLRRARSGRARLASASFEGIANPLSVGLVGAVAGIVLAVVVAPSVHHLSSEVPTVHVSLDAMLVGAGLAVAAAALSLPVAALLGVTEGRQPSRDPRAGVGPGAAPGTAGPSAVTLGNRTEELPVVDRTEEIPSVDRG